MRKHAVCKVDQATKYSIDEYLQEQEILRSPLNLAQTNEQYDDESDPITLMENDDRRDKYLSHIPPNTRATYDSLLVEIYRFHYLGLLVPTGTNHIESNERFYNRSQHKLRQVPRSIYDRLKRITPRMFLSIFPNIVGQISIHIEPTAIKGKKTDIKHEFPPTTTKSQTMDEYLVGSHLSEEAILTASSQLDKAITVEGRHRRHLIMESIRNFHDLGILLPTPYPGLESRDHYINRNSDQYRQVPYLIYRRLKRLNTKQLISLFPNVKNKAHIDLEPTINRLFDPRAFICRYRAIPSELRVKLKPVLLDIKDFPTAGLLLPAKNRRNTTEENYKNLSDHPHRHVVPPIFNRFCSLEPQQQNEILPNVRGRAYLSTKPNLPQLPNAASLITRVVIAQISSVKGTNKRLMDEIDKANPKAPRTEEQEEAIEDEEQQEDNPASLNINDTLGSATQSEGHEKDISIEHTNDQPGNHQHPFTP